MEIFWACENFDSEWSQDWISAKRSTPTTKSMWHVLFALAVIRVIYSENNK